MTNKHQLIDFQNVKFMENPQLVLREEKQRKLSWWKRLCSLKPWKAYESYVDIRPDPEIYYVPGANIVVGHPQTIAHIRAALKED